MSTPVSAPPADETLAISTPPLVQRVFGEARFHTDGDIAAVAFGADGRLFSVDEGGVLQHWAADGTPLARHFLSDIETLWCFAPGAALLASGNDDLLLWDVATGQLVGRIEHAGDEPAWVTALAFSADGRTVACGYDDGKLRFYDALAHTFQGEIAAHPRKGVSAVAFSPDGAFVATAGEGLAVRVWDAVTHKPVAELKSHTDRVPALTWRPDSTLLVSAGWDTSARVWRPPHPDPLMLLNSHADQVVMAAYSPDGAALACADSDFDIHLWLDAEGATRGPVLRGHTDDVRCLAFSPDGAKLASGGADRVIHVWDVRAGKLLAGPNPAGRHTIAVIPGSPLRLASSGAARLRVWDVESGAEVAPTDLCPAFAVAASPDGRWLAAGGTDHFTRLWNVAAGTAAATLEATKPPVGSVAFSPDSTTLAHTSPTDGLVWLWACATGQPRLILLEAADACTLEALAFHPNGNWVACGGVDYMSTGERDGAVCVWDVTTKEKLCTFDTGVTALAFDPRGKYLAGAGLEDAVYVWDADTQETVFVLGGHTQGVNAVCFDPTGSYLATAGDDGTVRAWDVLSGRQLAARALDGPVQALAFSPDGESLFCGNANTTCYQIEFRKFLDE